MKQNFVLKPFRLAALTAVLSVGVCGRVAMVGAEGIPPSAVTNALTLEGAIRSALDNNPDLRAAQARVGAAGARSYQAKLWSNPELTLSAEDWPLGGGGFAESKRLVGMAQTVPFPGKKQLDKKIGVSGVVVSEAEVAQRRIDLIREVKSAFYRVLAAKRVVEVQQELVGVAESSAETARKRVEAGGAADQEQLRAEIPLEQARTDLAGFERELVTARQSLSALLGRFEASDVPISGELSESARAGLLEQQPAEWLARQPGIAIARHNRERAELELRRARLELYPDVRVGVSGGRESDRGGSIVQVGISLPLPIIDRAKGKKMEARAGVSIAEAEATAVEQRLLRDWAAARERLRTANSQAANYRERILPKANEALRLVRTGFEEGKFGFIDLIDTQRTAAEARLGYQQKLLELNIAQAELEAFVADDSAANSTSANHNFQP